MTHVIFMTIVMQRNGGRMDHDEMARRAEFAYHAARRSVALDPETRWDRTAREYFALECLPRSYWDAWIEAWCEVEDADREDGTHGPKSYAQPPLDGCSCGHAEHEHDADGHCAVCLCDELRLGRYRRNRYAARTQPRALTYREPVRSQLRAGSVELLGLDL